MSIYGSGQHAQATYNAAGLVLNEALGLGVAVVANTNEYTAPLAVGYAIDETQSDVQATVSGATPGSVTVDLAQTDAAILARTWDGTGAAAALGFSLSVNRKSGAGSAGFQPPYGTLVAAANVDIVDGVPAIVGKSQGVSGVALFGVGIVDITLAPNSGIDTRNADVQVSGANILDAAPAGIRISWLFLGDNTLRIAISVAGTPTTLAFGFTVDRVDVGA